MRGAPSRFQICTVAQPSDLDAVLDRRAYTAEAHSSVQSASIAFVLSRTAARTTTQTVATIDAPSDEWFAAYCRAESVADREAATRRGILSRIAASTAYAAVFDEGRPASVGLGVVEGGWLGIFSMATSPHFRRRGAATAILRSSRVGTTPGRPRRLPPGHEPEPNGAVRLRPLRLYHALPASLPDPRSAGHLQPAVAFRLYVSSKETARDAPPPLMH